MKRLLVILAALACFVPVFSGDTYVKEIRGTGLAGLDNAFEVLKRISILSETEGTFFVVGQEAAVIYVDGRRISNHSELYLIPARVVDAVEILTESNAKYGNRGNVVLISTIRPEENEFNLEDVAGMTVGPLFGGSNDFIVSGRKNKFLFEGNISVDNDVSKDKEKRFGDVYSDLPINGSRCLDVRTVKEFLDVNRDLSLSANGKFGYYITPEHQVSLRYRYDYIRSRGSWDDLHFDVFRRNNGILDLDNPIESYNGESTSSADLHGHTVNLGYEGKVKDWKFTANIDLYGVFRHSRDLDYESWSDIRTCTCDSKDVYEYSEDYIRVVASHPLWMGYISFGVAMDDYLQQTSSNDLTVDDNLVHASTYILAPMAFAFLDQSFGTVDINAGLVYQCAFYGYLPYDDDQTAHIIQEKTGRRDIHWHRNSFQPHFAVSAKAGNVKLSAGINSSVVLPDFTDVSIKADRIVGKDAYKALPQAEEQFSGFVKATWKWIDFKGWCTRYHLPIFNDVGNSYDINGPDYWAMDYRLTFSPSVGFWTPSFTATLHKQRLGMEVVDPVDNLNAPLGIFQWNNGFQFPWGMRLDVNAFVRTAGADRNTCFRKPSWRVDAALSQSFFRNHFNVTFGVNNLFDRYGETVAFYKDASVSELDLKNRSMSRMFILSLRYSL